MSLEERNYDPALMYGAENSTNQNVITSSSANALAVGRQGSTSPALKVDASTSSSATGLEIIAAASGSGVAVRAIGGTNEALTINAKGTGTIGIGSVSTGAVTITPGLLFKDLTEVVTATNVITAAESGSVFFLNSATEFASTLPAVAAGLHFTFIVTAAPSGASYTVAAASGTPIHGMVLSKDLNGATDSGATAGTGVLTLTFVDGKSQKGDSAEFWCDGTDWFVVARTGGNFDAITLS